MGPSPQSSARRWIAPLGWRERAFATALIALAGFGCGDLLRAFLTSRAAAPSLEFDAGALLAAAVGITMLLRRAPAAWRPGVLIAGAADGTYRKLADAAFEAVLLHVDGIVVDANPAAGELFRCAAVDLLGRDALELASPMERARIAARIEGDAESPIRTVIQRHDGSTAPVESQSRTLRLPDGRTARLVVLRDLSSMETMAATLQRTIDLLHLLSDNTTHAFTVVDTDCRLLAFNRVAEIQARALLGRDLETGDDVLEVLDPGRREAFRALVRRAISGETVRALESFATPDGIAHWEDLVLLPAHDAAGTVVGATIDVTDVTDRVRAQSERRWLAQAVEQSPVIVILTDLEGRITWVNPRFTAVYGYPAEEVIGRTPPEVFVETIRDDTHAHLVELLGRGESWRGQARSRRRDGTLFWEDVSISPVRDEQGVVRQFVAVREDITRRLETEEALRTSEERYRTLLETTHDAVFVLAPDGTVTAANPSSDLLRDAQGAAGPGRHLADLLHPHEATAVRALLDGIARTGSAACTELRTRAADGGYRDVEYTVVPHLEAGSVTRLLGIGRDVTDRKRAQETLRKNEELFRLLVEHGSDAVVLLGDDDVVLYASASIAHVLGFTADEVTGRPLDARLHPEDRDTIAAFIDGIRGENPHARQCVCRMGDAEGSWRTIEITAGERADTTVIHGVVLTLHDVTAITDATRALRTSLLEKDVLLREIHHRVKNNMQVISSMLHLQSARVATADARTILLDSQNRVLAMALVHELLYGTPDLAHVPVRHYLERLTAQVAASFGTTFPAVRVEIDATDEDLSIEQAIPCGMIAVELLSNAYKHAFAPGAPGRIRVTFRRIGDRLHLTVSDDGVGLEPYTHLEDSPSLGLQLVTTLARQLQGDLRVARDRGTAFHLSFPTPPPREPAGTMPPTVD